jgi:hypothetical protein
MTRGTNNLWVAASSHRLAKTAFLRPTYLNPSQYYVSYEEIVAAKLGRDYEVLVPRNGSADYGSPVSKLKINFQFMFNKITPLTCIFWAAA